jgi:hypothetical protein
MVGLTKCGNIRLDGQSGLTREHIMKTIKLITLALFMAITTACVVYDPGWYDYPSRRVIVERDPIYDGRVYEYEYEAPPPPVVIDPFWAFPPLYFGGHYHGHYGYHHGRHYGGRHYGGHYGGHHYRHR